MRSIHTGSLVLCCAAALLSARDAHAAYAQVWQVGLDNNSNGDFSNESGGSNAAPGSALVKDDDWYFAGTYPSPIGTLATDEPSATNFERALTVADPTDRIHFNLAGANLDPATEFRLVIDTVSNNSAVTTSPIPFTASVNGVEVFSGSVNALAQTFTTPSFTASSVGATSGDNVVTLTRGSTGAGWMQFDFVRLESQPVPEPSAALAAGCVAAAAGLRRRRRSQ